MLAVSVTLTEGSATVNGQSQTAPYTWNTQQGGKVETDATQTATLRFDADASIIRLDKTTRISLDPALNSQGKTIAQATLAEGVLWGRILTEDGVNFSNGSLVA
jgi:hypothetical protein